MIAFFLLFSTKQSSQLSAITYSRDENYKIGKSVSLYIVIPITSYPNGMFLLHEEIKALKIDHFPSLVSI